MDVKASLKMTFLAKHVEKYAICPEKCDSQTKELDYEVMISFISKKPSKTNWIKRLNIY